MDEVDTDNIVYMNCDKNKKEINIQYINSDNIRVPFILQTEDLFMIDDVQYNNDKNMNVYEIILLLIGRTNEDSNKIKTFFESLDNKFIGDAKEYSNIWFPDKIIKYKSIIRHISSDDEEDKKNLNNNFLYTNGLLKLKLFDTKSFKTNIYNDKKELLKKTEYDSLLCGGCYVKCIIEFVSLWFENDVFGVTMRVHQIKISKGKFPILTLNEYSFDDNNSNDNNYNLVSDTEIYHNDIHTSDDDIID